VTKILNRFENRIKIEGAVLDQISIRFMKECVSDLDRKRLKEDAYSKRARILRVKGDLTNEIVNVDLEQAMNGNLEADIELKKKMW
jgi:hypothetical protein